MKLNVGSKAPDFTAPDQTGAVRSLKDYRGKWILLYFYPKDMTPGCTIEACTLRDEFAGFRRRGIVILGVSTDTAASHDKFTKKYQLPFTLLSDPNKTVVKAYGVWGIKKFMGRTFQGTRRMSFLINPDGEIAKMYDTVKPAEHASQVLKDHAALT